MCPRAHPNVYNDPIRLYRTWLAAIAGVSALAATARAQVVINEVDYDQDGVDDAEFIELFNAGAGAVDLDGHVIELVEGSTDQAVVYRAVDLPAVALGPGELFVVCVSQEITPNCDISIAAGSEVIHNGPFGAVAIRGGGGDLLDVVSYEGSVVAPYTEGRGVTAGNPDLVFASIGRFPDGSDTQDNSADFIGACATPGDPNVDQIADCCGDGQVSGDEACDEGRQNGQVPCGCRSDCTLAPEASECVVSDCEIGVCDAAGRCVEPRLAEAGTPCGDLTESDCTGVDTCDGAGNCVANDAPDNQACDDGSEALGCPGLCSTGACVARAEAGECAPLVCGDGVVEAPEECDDGNDAAGDGCDRCAREGGGGGCACQSAGPGGAGLALLLLAFAWRRRHNRRR